MGKYFDTWIASRLSGLVGLIGLLLVLGPAVVGYYRDASTAVKVVIAVGVALLITAAILEIYRRSVVSATTALRDASARVTDFLRARAARAGGEPSVSADLDWQRHHHGGEEHQHETVALYYESYRRLVLDALDRPQVAKHITRDQRRFAQQPRNVEDIWATAELLSATNRAIQKLTDPAYDQPYAYEDRA
jgi:hypothetical protein